MSDAPKKGRGRPKGSTNKAKADAAPKTTKAPKGPTVPTAGGDVNTDHNNPRVARVARPEDFDHVQLDRAFAQPQSESTSSSSALPPPVVMTKSRCMSGRIDQPTTLRLNRSMTTARNSQPSSVAI